MAELRYATRSLSRRPWFFLAAVASLALGIGANATVFTIVDALLFRPLPYAEADRVVIVRAENSRLGVGRGGVSVAELEAVRSRVGSLRGAGVVREGDFNVTLADGPRRLRGAVVSAATLSTIGVAPRLGGPFTPDDDRPGARPRVMVSDALWRSALGATPDLARAVVRIDGAAFDVAGVMPPAFRFPEQAELWLTLGSWETASARALDRDARLYQIVARLAPDVSIGAARAAVAGVARDLDAQRAMSARGWTLTVISAESERGENARPAVYLLFSLVTCVLLVACANLAALLMVRAIGRRRELAIRLALGASRARLVWHGLTESLVLAAVGMALGLGVAALGVRAVRLAFPAATLPFWLRFAIDYRVVAYTLGVALIAALAFGLTPALWSARRATAAGLGAGSRSATDGPARGRLTGALVGGQVAVSLVLVVTASLLGSALRSMRTTDLGYEPRGLLVTDVEPRARRYADSDARRAYFGLLATQLRSIPGVQQVSGFDLWGSATLEIARSSGSALQRVDAPVYSVLPDYFETMRVPLAAGRVIGAEDVAGSAPVAVVNRTFARRFWPNESPLGGRLRVATGHRDTAWLTVVGVVGDLRRNPADLEWEPHVYVAAHQFPPGRLQLLVRTGDAPVATRALSDAARSADRDEPLGPITTMAQQIGVWTAPSRFFAVALSAFAVVAMTIALAGVYGLVAGGVTSRTREFGIRLALGATPSNVVALAVRRGGRLAVGGAAVGLGGAVAVSRVLLTLPLGLERVDPLTVIAATLALVSVALLAAYGPARRAGRVQPAVALSDDR